MKRVLILVEGQTEERFIKDVLAPEFLPVGLDIRATLLVTKRVKDGPNYKGGVTNFAKFENDARRLLNNSGGALVTTLLDYYGLPTDFPGMATRPQYGTALQRVTHVEVAIHNFFGNRPDLVPFLALHEFEAWLFSSSTELPTVMTQPQKEAEFVSIRKQFATPEHINDRPLLAPSKRIASLFPSYRKTLHGPATVQRIGLTRIRAECAHLASWLDRLDTYAASQSSRVGP